MTSLVLITFINCLVISTAVIVHHECLIVLSRVLRKHESKARTKVLLGVFGSLIALSTEVWIFAIAIYLLILQGGWGVMEGSFDGSIIDCVYLSFTCFTTVGFGDIVPTGSIRFLIALESLTGLVLITWTASFLYLQMQQFWHDD